MKTKYQKMLAMLKMGATEGREEKVRLYEERRDKELLDCGLEY